MTSPDGAHDQVPLTPGRGIEFARQTDAGLELFCDCGATTILASGDADGTPPLDIAAAEQEVITVPASGGEVAFTCPGCKTVHWLTFTPRQVPGG